MPDCPCCGQGRFEYLDGAKSATSSALCGRSAVQVLPAEGRRVSLPHLAEKLARLCDVTLNEYLLRARVDGLEITVFPDGRAIVKGTDDLAAARAVVAKYVGS